MRFARVPIKDGSEWEVTEVEVTEAGDSIFYFSFNQGTSRHFGLFYLTGTTNSMANQQHGQSTAWPINSMANQQHGQSTAWPINSMANRHYTPIPVDPGPYHAYYSAQAAHWYGSGIWLNAAGQEVEVTCVDSSNTWMLGNYNWPDREYRGIVVRRLRRGAVGIKMSDWMYWYLDQIVKSDS